MTDGRWHDGVAMTAVALFEDSPDGLVELVAAGAERPVLGLEVVEVGDQVAVGRGNLVTVLGARGASEIAAMIPSCANASGLLLRRALADDPIVVRGCAELGITLLAMAQGAALTSVITAVRSAIEVAATPRRTVRTQRDDDLFHLADRISAMIEAPVTIEDADSHVRAYSEGQSNVDAARTATIVGRRVPRAVRDHYRSLGVFRRLAASDTPFLVGAGADEVKARYVIPVRAGNEWLGSIWAIVEGPVPSEHDRELKEVTELVARSLLHLRAQTELHRQGQLDRIRSLLRGSTDGNPDWLSAGPWRAAVLAGPSHLSAEARCQLWHTVCRRRGWRQPIIADVGDHVYAVFRVGGSVPGTEEWLSALVRSEHRAHSSVRMYLGTIVEMPSELHASRVTARELETVSSRADAVLTVADEWPAIVLARALDGPEDRPVVSPLGELLDPNRNSSVLLDTVEALIDYWGEPVRAARSIGVHPNTMRNRQARIAESYPVDLRDPAQRLAVRLEIARVRAQAGRSST